jgi:hypothetical protein
MKTLIALAVLALTGFVLPANSQNMLGRANAINRQWRAEQGYPPVSRGQSYRNDYAYGHYQYNAYGRVPYGRPSTVGVAIVGGVIGGIIGAAIGGNRGHNQSYDTYGQPVYTNNTTVNVKPPKPLDCGKKKNKSACDQIAAEEAAAEAMRNARWKLYNNSGFAIQVLDCGQEVGELKAGQSSPAVEAKCGYVGRMLLPSNTTPGRTETFQADFRLANDRTGWVFRAPAGGGS